MRYLLLMALLSTLALRPTAAEAGELPQGAAEGSDTAPNGSGGTAQPATLYVRSAVLPGRGPTAC